MLEGVHRCSPFWAWYLSFFTEEPYLKDEPQGYSRGASFWRQVQAEVRWCSPAKPNNRLDRSLSRWMINQKSFAEGHYSGHELQAGVHQGCNSATLLSLTTRYTVTNWAGRLTWQVSTEGFILTCSASRGARVFPSVKSSEGAVLQGQSEVKDHPAVYHRGASMFLC